MANTFTKQTLVDGPRNAVIQAYLASDGASGEISDGVLVDASALSGTFTKLKVKQVHASLSGFAAQLEWDATTDVPFLQLIEGETDHHWGSVGGLQDNSGAGSTGDILINTNGFTAAGDDGHITIHVQKS